MVITRLQAKRRRLEMEGTASTEEAESSLVENEREDGNNTAVGDFPAENGLHKCPGATNSIHRPPPSSSTGNQRSRRGRSSHSSPPQFQDYSQGAIPHDCTRPEHHDVLIHVAPFGEKVRYGKRAALAIGHDYFRFRCPLGDIWHDVFTSVCRHRQVKTGDPWIDRAIRSLPFQGYDISYVTSMGRHSYILVGNCSAKYGQMVAVKMLKPERTKQRVTKPSVMVAPWNVEYPEEVAIHRKLKHPNVVTWLDYMTYMNRKCIILEFCHLGDVEELLQATPGKFFTEGVARIYFQQMVSAIEYIHSQDVVHRDICTRNWVVDQCNVVKLIDFGSACHWSGVDGLVVEPPSGHPGYQVREALLGEPHNLKSADVWSLAVVCYKMLTSRLPFGTEPEFLPGAMQKIPLPQPSVLPLGRDAVLLLESMLHANPVCRHSINRIKQSSWFKLSNEKLFISNFFRNRMPEKLKEGDLEKRWKQTMHLHKMPTKYAAWEPKVVKKHVKSKPASSTSHPTESKKTSKPPPVASTPVASGAPTAPGNRHQPATEIRPASGQEVSSEAQAQERPAVSGGAAPN